VELIWSGQQVFDAHGEFADADTGGMVDRAGDGGGDAGETDLSDAAGAKRVEHQVGWSRKVTSIEGASALVVSM